MDYPTILSQHFSDQQLRLELDISRELNAFEGHFVQFPIVPGVVQVGWALHYFKNLLATKLNLPVTGCVNTISNLKFQHIISPETPVLLELSFDSDKEQLIFRFFNHENQFSSGRILFVESPTHHIKL